MWVLTGRRMVPAVAGTCHGRQGAGLGSESEHLGPLPVPAWQMVIVRGPTATSRQITASKLFCGATIAAAAPMVNIEQPMARIVRVIMAVEINTDRTHPPPQKHKFKMPCGTRATLAGTGSKRLRPMQSRSGSVVEEQRCTGGG